MYEEITNLITPCCIDHKLHSITQSQLAADAPLATCLYTMGDITLCDLLSWLIVRFPASTMTIVTPTMPLALANTLQRYLSRYWNDGKCYIDHLNLCLAPPEEGDIMLTHLDDWKGDNITLHMSRQHNIDTLILLSSRKGTVTLQGNWPLHTTKPTLAVMTYSNSHQIYDQSFLLLRFLRKLNKTH